MQSQQLLGNEAAQLTLVEGASAWQIYFNRGGQWSNPQSTGNLLQPAAAQAAAAQAAASQASQASQTAGAGGTAAAAAAAAGGAAPGGPAVAPREMLPDAVRLVLTLDGTTLTRDIALGPAGS